MSNENVPGAVVIDSVLTLTDQPTTALRSPTAIVSVETGAYPSVFTHGRRAIKQSPKGLGKLSNVGTPSYQGIINEGV